MPPTRGAYALTLGGINYAAHMRWVWGAYALDLGRICPRAGGHIMRSLWGTHKRIKIVYSRSRSRLTVLRPA